MESNNSQEASMVARGLTNLKPSNLQTLLVQLPEITESHGGA